MTNDTLAQSYLRKSKSRLKLLPILLKDKNYSDVIREAQEIVELSIKGMLRQIGIEPPKWHDVGKLLAEKKELLPSEIENQLDRIASISRYLRKERELAFYGETDFIPTEEYDPKTAKQAIRDAKFIVSCAKKVIRLP
jgi:HEPN domain-containing protein